MAYKYDRFHKFLLASPAKPEETLTLSLDQIEQINGNELPWSAHIYGAAWWANDKRGHTQARAWLDAGFLAIPNSGRYCRIVMFKKLRPKPQVGPALFKFVPKRPEDLEKKQPQPEPPSP